MFAMNDNIDILPTNDTERQQWDIRNFINQLEPAKEKNKYICPACEGHNLAIDPKNGKYQCWNGCDNAAVREAIRPWSEVVANKGKGDCLRQCAPRNRTPYNPLPPKKPKPKPNPTPAPFPDTLDIATLPDELEIGEITTEYMYSPNTKTVRIDNPDGTKLGVFPYHRSSDGWIKGEGEEKFLPYKLSDIAKYGTGKWVLGVEGEKCVEYARKYFRLVSFTFSGGSWGKESLGKNFAMLQATNIAGVIYWPDHDQTGYSKAEKCREACTQLGIPFVELDPLAIREEMPAKGDIADLIEIMGNEELISRIQSQLSIAKIKTEEKPSEKKVVSFPTKESMSGDELLQAIEELIERNPSHSLKEISIQDLARKSNRQTLEIDRIYKTRERELERSADASAVRSRLPSLLEAQKARLLPGHVLWGDGGKLAEVMEKVANAMPTAPEMLLSTFFPVAASLVGTSSRIVVNPSAKYVDKCIFWSAIVAPTGSLKSPVQQAIIEPLLKMESVEYEQWRVAYEDYQRQMKSCKKGEAPPEEPVPRKRFILQGGTAEARIQRHAENPKGFLYFRDEWSGFLNSRNQYRAGGKGDELERDLSEFNGGTLSKDLVSSSIFLERSAVSRTGNTQPETLKKLQSANNFEDHAGEFARWLFCLVPTPPAFLNLFQHEDGTGQQFDQLLGELYRKLSFLPERDYFLTDDAKRIFQDYQHKLIHLAIEEEHAGLRATMPKLQTYLGRFTLLLHLINEVLGGKSIPGQFIDSLVVAIACEVCDFYLAQARLLYALNSTQQSLAGNLLKIKAFVEKRPQGVRVRDVQAGIRELRSIAASDVEGDLQYLVSMGLIDHVSKRYYPLGSAKTEKSADTADKMLTTCQQPQTLTDKGLEKSADTADNFSPILEISKSGNDLTNDLVQSSFLEKSCQHCQQIAETPTLQNLETADSLSAIVSTVSTVNQDVSTVSTTEINEMPTQQVIEDNSIDSSTQIAIAPADKSADKSADNLSATTQAEGGGGVSTNFVCTTDASVKVPARMTSNAPSPQQTQKTEEKEAPSSSVAIAPPAITKGTRVRVHCPGSKRHGKEGVITSVKGSMSYVRLQDVETQLQDWKCPLPGNEMMMLEVIP